MAVCGVDGSDEPLAHPEMTLVLKNTFWHTVEELEDYKPRRTKSCPARFCDSRTSSVDDFTTVGDALPHRSAVGLSELQAVQAEEELVESNEIEKNAVVKSAEIQAQLIDSAASLLGSESVNSAKKKKRKRPVKREGSEGCHAPLIEPCAEPEPSEDSNFRELPSLWTAKQGRTFKKAQQPRQKALRLHPMTGDTIKSGMLSVSWLRALFARCAGWPAYLCGAMLGILLFGEVCPLQNGGSRWQIARTLAKQAVCSDLPTPTSQPAVQEACENSGAMFDPEKRTLTDRDMAALLAFMNSGGRSWPKNLLGWREGVDVCFWTGVTCNPDRRVIFLDLWHAPNVPSSTLTKKQSAALHGNISELIPLSNLSRLRLFPAAGIVGDIQHLASLSSLTQVDLGDTGVHGDIGPLTSLRQLVFLSLFSTAVSGNIQELTPLTKLTDVRLFSTGVWGDVRGVCSSCGPCMNGTSTACFFYDHCAGGQYDESDINAFGPQHIRRSHSCGSGLRLREGAEHVMGNTDAECCVQSSEL